MAGPRFGLDGTQSSGEQYARDLTRAAGYKPVTQQDLADAYKQYDQKVGQVKKGNSDAFLRKRATDTVIAWWKKQKATEAAKKKAAATPPPAKSPAKGSAGTGGSGGGGGGGYGSGGSGGTGGSKGTLLPDTSMSAVGAKAPVLKPIPRPLTTSYVKTQLNAAGFPTAKPPAYALKNKETFDAWLKRAKLQRAKQGGRARTPVAVRPAPVARAPIKTNTPQYKASKGGNRLI